MLLNRVNLLPLMALILGGCAATGELKSTNIYRETDNLEKVLTDSARVMRPSVEGEQMYVINVAGFPERIVERNGISYTVFRLGEPIYSPGNLPWDDYSGAYVPARLDIRRGDVRFALRSKISFLTHRSWVFWKQPYLYFFPALLTSSYIPYKGGNLRVLDPSTQTHLSTWSSLMPMDLPDHLSDLRSSLIFIAEESYNLDAPNAIIPSNIQLSLDLHNTMKFYRKLKEGDLEEYGSIDEHNVERILRWLDAHPLRIEALEYHSGEKTPYFVAIDRENLVHIRRKEKARDLLIAAIHADPEWNDLPDSLYAVEKDLRAYRNFSSDERAMGQRLFFGIGTKLIYFGEAYAQPFPEAMISAHFSIFAQYQISQNLSLTIGDEPVKFILDDYKGSITPYGSQISFEQMTFSVNCQTPVRMQLGGWGSRIQFSCGLIRLHEVIEHDSIEYAGSGFALDLGVSLVPRKNVHYRGPESMLVNRSGLLEIGYRIGEIKSFTSDESGNQATLLDFKGAPLSYRPRGFWIAVNLDFMGW